VDPQIYESLRSHFQQDYPEYEIIFGVNDAGDEALPAVRRLQQEFPDRAVQVVVCSEVLGTNRKISNLIQMMKTARHPCLLLNDSDIRVEPDYLRRTLAPLADPAVGLVTCLYKGAAAGTLGSRLEALGISTDFIAGVIAARQLEKTVRFGLGSTLAFRRRELDAIGGFEPIVDLLADDYELGNRIANLDFKVELSEVVVETFLPAYSFRQFLSHQMRWARGVRDARLGGYIGLAVTFGVAWSLLTLLLSHGALWAWGLFVVTVAARLVMALSVGVGVLRDAEVPRRLWMIPFRDLLHACVWLASFAGSTVSWRGEDFRLKHGKLYRM
jgi:ceramide glucosyltransferase